MRRVSLALVLVILPSMAWAQQPVTITNVQAVDYIHDAALSLGTTSGPVGMCRTSATRPTVATGDTRAFAVWCNLYGATHTVATDNAGNDLTSGSLFYRLSTASTNSVSIKGTAGTLHLLHLSNPGGTAGYLKTYDSASAPTCSSATGLKDVLWVGAGATNGRAYPIPATFTNGIGICFTASGTDTANDSGPANVEIHAEFK